MRDAFSTMTDNLPPELAGWFGADGQIWSTLKGYIGLEIVGQMGLVGVVFGILFALSMLVADEQNGTILTQLSKPLSRTQLFIGKYVAVLIATIIVMVGFILGTWFGSLTVDPIPFGELVSPTIAVSLLVLTFASITFAISAAGLSKTISGVIAGAYALFGYFITALQGSVDLLKFLASLTPFKYYNTPNVIYEGIKIDNVFVLLAIIVIPMVVSFFVFCKRDLRNR
jgi:ABC-type transport system involved in multi-copper enzyme maturation permease subunit